jgi:hypothetical protein
MESFYRRMRVEHGVLVDAEGAPAGGTWNYDADNRGAFGREGPGFLPKPPSFEPDAITREVLADIETHFGDHYGSAACARLSRRSVSSNPFLRRRRCRRSVVRQEIRRFCRRSQRHSRTGPRTVARMSNSFART